MVEIPPMAKCEPWVGHPAPITLCARIRHPGSGGSGTHVSESRRGAPELVRAHAMYLGLDSILRNLLLMRFCLILSLVVSFGLALSAPPAASAQTPAEAAAQQRSSQNHAAYTLPPEKLKTAIEYSRKRVILDFAGTGWSIVQLVLLLALGTAAWMRRVALKTGSNKWAQGFTFFFLFTGITSLLSLPLEMYGHHVSVAYGQSVQHWGSWFADQAKSFALAYLVGGLLFMLLFFVIGKSPQRWWFWFWIPAMAATVFGIFIAPVFIDPLFNHFEALQKSNPALVERLEQVVARGGITISPDRMFLMKASEKVTGLNAYVTGIGASKRVVVWDTSIAKATPDEISFIFGHEMGHYVLNHIYKGLAFASGLLLVLFWLGYHTQCAMAVEALWRGMGNSGAAQLGGFRGVDAGAVGAVVPVGADQQRLQPLGGARRRCVRAGGHPRHRRRPADDRAAGLSGARRAVAGRPQPEPVC